MLGYLILLLPRLEKTHEMCIAVEESLRLLVRTKNQSRLKQFRGKLKWDGSLDDMRRDK